MQNPDGADSSRAADPDRPARGFARGALPDLRHSPESPTLVSVRQQGVGQALASPAQRHARYSCPAGDPDRGFAWADAGDGDGGNRDRPGTRSRGGSGGAGRARRCPVPANHPLPLVASAGVRFRRMPQPVPRTMPSICPIQSCGRCFGRRGTWCWWTMRSPLAAPWWSWRAPICDLIPGSNRSCWPALPTGWMRVGGGTYALLGRPVCFPALVEGGFQFEPDPDFPPPALPVVNAAVVRAHDGMGADPARTACSPAAGAQRLNPLFPRS